MPAFYIKKTINRTIDVNTVKKSVYNIQNRVKLFSS